MNNVTFTFHLVLYLYISPTSQEKEAWERDILIDQYHKQDLDNRSVYQSGQLDSEVRNTGWFF